MSDTGLSRSDTKPDSKRITTPLDATGALLWLVMSGLGCTWRYRTLGLDPYSPYSQQGLLYCFWHAHLLSIGYGFRHSGVWSVISASQDGTRASAVVERWGYRTIRGSSSRGGISVLRACMRVINSRGNIALIPDGPRGPRHRVKRGIGAIALRTGAPVVAVGASVDRSFVLRSWDRFIVPLPFSTITVTVKGVVRPGDFSSNDVGVGQLCSAVEQALLS